MTRRAKVLDERVREVTCSLHPSTLRKPGVPAGIVRHRTMRTSIQIMARKDRAGYGVSPFYLSGSCGKHPHQPGSDPFGNLPEFKFSAARVEKVQTDFAADLPDIVNIKRGTGAWPSKATSK